MSNVTPFPGVYDQETDVPALYEIVVTNEPDHDGHYKASVKRDGRHVTGSTTFSADRDKAISKARSFAEWHKTLEGSTETIPV